MTKSYGPYDAKVIEVHDGDTIGLDIDLGFDHIVLAKSFTGGPQLSCRIMGINAPELKTASGKKAAVFAQGLLPVGTLVRVVSFGWDKYGGRFDGSITLPDGRDFGTVMLSTGHAVPFSGG